MSDRTSSALAAQLLRRREPRRPQDRAGAATSVVRASVVIDRPKSPTSTRPSRSTKQFDGLMSRCRMPMRARPRRARRSTWRIASTAAPASSACRGRRGPSACPPAPAPSRSPGSPGPRWCRTRRRSCGWLSEAASCPSREKPLALLVVAEAAAEDLHRDAPAAVDLLRLVDLAHAALAERTDDQVGAEALARRRRGTADRPEARCRCGATIASTPSDDHIAAKSVSRVRVCVWSRSFPDSGIR